MIERDNIVSRLYARYVSGYSYDESSKLYLLHYYQLSTGDVMNVLFNTLNIDKKQAFVNYIPHNTLLLHVPSNVVAEIQAYFSSSNNNNEGVDEKKNVWIGEYQPHHKIDAQLYRYNDGLLASKTTKEQKSAHKLSSDVMDESNHEEPSVNVKVRVVSTAKQTDVDRLFGAINDIEGVAVGTERNIIAVKNVKSHVQLTNVLNVCESSNIIEYVEPEMPMKLHNEYARFIIGEHSTVKSYNSMPMYAKDIKGDNQIVCVADTGVSTSSCFFNDVVGYQPIADSVDGHGHGTHVAGSVLGRNTATDGDNGMAPNARLYVQDISSNGVFNVPTSLYSGLFQDAYNQGARIHTNSWGCARSFGSQTTLNDCNQYTSSSRDVDEFMYDKDDFLVLFAAGNDGQWGVFKNLGSPATCKNCISVGAASSSYQMWTTRSASNEVLVAEGNSGYFDQDSLAVFSGAGPTWDGRRKPDLVAPGYSIQSAHNQLSCGTQVMSGTSMATPVTAGAAALIRQYLVDGYYPSGSKVAADSISKPTGALIKALLIGGATRMKRRQLDSAVRFDEIPNDQNAVPVTQSSEGGHTFYAISCNKLYSLTLTGTEEFYMKFTTPSSAAKVEVRFAGLSAFSSTVEMNVDTTSAVNSANRNKGTDTYSSLSGMKVEWIQSASAVTYYIQVKRSDGGVTSSNVVQVLTYVTSPEKLRNATCSTTASSLPRKITDDNTYVSPYYAFECPSYDTVMSTCSKSGVVGSRNVRVDSPICIAAIHSGVLTKENRVIAVRRSYISSGFFGTSSNGITSVSSSAADRSYYMTTIGKAVQTNSVISYAVDEALPHKAFGFGLVNLQRSVFLNDSVSPYVLILNKGDSGGKRVYDGGVIKYKFTTSSPSESVRVTLVWSDPAPSLAASLDLVNNLDLSVKTPSDSVAQKTSDVLNNVEMLESEQVSSGQYEISVHGASVPTAPQKFALVVHFGNLTLGSEISDPTVEEVGNVPKKDDKPNVDKPNVGLIVGLVVAAVVIVAILAVVYHCVLKSKANGSSSAPSSYRGGNSAPPPPPQTNYTQAPEYAQPVYAQPAVNAQPAYAQPAYAQPAYGQPAANTQAAYAQPAYGQTQQAIGEGEGYALPPPPPSYSQAVDVEMTTSTKPTYY